jgi:hypothetical protein
MALREFVDAQGRRWRVWQTVPARGAELGEFRDGWLTFDDGTERRRFAPVPDGWPGFTDERLGLLLRVAQSSSGQVVAQSSGRVVGYVGAERRHAERRIVNRRERDRRQGGRRRS